MNRKERRAAAKSGHASASVAAPAALFAAAVKHHEAGRLAQAEALYRQVLAANPRHADSWHLLGLLAHQAGENDMAVDLIANAIALNDRVPVYHSNIGAACRASGRLTDAVTHFERALALKPDYPAAHYNLGLALHAEGQLEVAVASYRKAAALKPNFTDAHTNLGLALRELGQLDAAVACYRAAANLNPNDPELHNNLGSALMELGQLDEAAAAYRRALDLLPNYAEAHNNLGAALKEQKRLDDAVACYNKALQLQPDYPEARNNLGLALQESGQLDDAVASFNEALRLRPNYPEARSNLGLALQDQGQLDRAITEFRTAIDIAPEDATAHWNLGLALLLRGDFPAGWHEYEWRHRTKLFPPRDFHQPAWAGEDLAGRTILLHAEQGVGDTIQFVRYADDIKKLGARVIVECQPGTDRLLESVPGIDHLVVKGDALPAFDCHAPLLSLPHLLGTGQDRIPAGAPYIHPRPELAEMWRKRLSGAGPNIGLVWRGNPNHRNDRRRSIAAHDISEILAQREANWFSVQKDARADEIEALSRHVKIFDCGPLLTDWAETAALISTLDLLVTVDTAAAHLAGALGKPAWVLLPFNPDWRWQLNRLDSPWYPTLRLFRQPSPGDWESVLSEVRRELDGVV